VQLFHNHTSKNSFQR